MTCVSAAISAPVVTSRLAALPCGVLGPGTLHRVIADCQRTFLLAGAVAVGPSPKQPNTTIPRIGRVSRA